MTKIEIKSVFGGLLFAYEAENATIKDAVEKAVKEKVDLMNSNLSYSDLRNSNLSGSKNKENAFLPLFCKWSFSIIGEKIQIGCKQKTIEDLDLFFSSSEVYSTERNTDDFKQIEAVYNACKAYLLTLNK